MTNEICRIICNDIYPEELGLECTNDSSNQGQKIILPKNRDTAIFNRLYITLYIKFVANNGEKSRFRTCRDFLCY